MTKNITYDLDLPPGTYIPGQDDPHRLVRTGARTIASDQVRHKVPNPRPIPRGKILTQQDHEDIRAFVHAGVKGRGLRVAAKKWGISVNRAMAICRSKPSCDE